MTHWKDIGRKQKHITETANEALRKGKVNIKKQK